MEKHQSIKITAAVDLIAEERQRQIEVEGWTAEHDDSTAGSGELARAAACYLIGDTPLILRSIPIGSKEIPGGYALWPWNRDWWKPSEVDRVRDLVRAGALIVAEIDRINRERERQ